MADEGKISRFNVLDTDVRSMRLPSVGSVGVRGVHGLEEGQADGVVRTSIKQLTAAGYIWQCSSAGCSDGWRNSADCIGNNDRMEGLGRCASGDVGGGHGSKTLERPSGDLEQNKNERQNPSVRD